MIPADLIGLPYLSKGRTVNGTDCWGLVCMFYAGVFQIELPSYSEQYKSSEDRATVSQSVISNLGNWAKVDKPAYGDLLVFNILGLPVHTAVYVGGGDFLHCFHKTNTCIERLSSITWNRRLHGIYRWAKT